MKKTKRLLALALALGMMAGLTACGGWDICGGHGKRPGRRRFALCERRG